MNQRRSLPDLNQVSMIVASILLAYAISRISSIPTREVRLQLPGFFISFNLNVQFITIPFVAGLAASGSDWLVHTHPFWKGRFAIRHWLLPMLTALVLGFPITQLPYGVTWWLTFLIGAAILMAVLLAEYITVDPHDIRQPLASSSLISVSYTLFFIFCIAIYLLSYRLIFALPAITLASFIVSLRSFNLYNSEYWAYLESGLIALITCQISTALHYWPLSPIACALALLGPSYAIFIYTTRINQQEKRKNIFLEPALILFVCWFLAYWLK